jgi:hypothetical protein
MNLAITRSLMLLMHISVLPSLIQQTFISRPVYSFSEAARLMAFLCKPVLRFLRMSILKHIKLLVL